MVHPVGSHLYQKSNKMSGIESNYNWGQQQYQSKNNSNDGNNLVVMGGYPSDQYQNILPSTQVQHYKPYQF